MKGLPIPEGGSGGSTAAGASARSDPEPPKEYVDSSGRLKFNKRDPGTGEAGREREERRQKKKARRGSGAKLSNAKLLSFGDGNDDDDG